MSYYSTKDGKITIEVIKNINSKPVFFHDKDGDGHYDVLSALQKNITLSRPQNTATFPNTGSITVGRSAGTLYNIMAKSMILR